MSRLIHVQDIFSFLSSNCLQETRTQAANSTCSKEKSFCFAFPNDSECQKKPSVVSPKKKVEKNGTKRNFETNRKSFSRSTSESEVMRCSLLHLSTSVFQQFTFFMLFIWVDAREKIFISLFIMRYFYTAEMNFFLVQFFKQNFSSPRCEINDCESPFTFLRDKLFRQLLLLLRINAFVVQFFTHFSAVPQNYFVEEKWEETFALLILVFFLSLFPICGVWHFEGEKKCWISKNYLEDKLLERTLWKSW